MNIKDFLCWSLLYKFPDSEDVSVIKTMNTTCTCQHITFTLQLPK